MIIITDGKESFKLNKRQLILAERGYVINIVKNMWFIELFLEKDKNNNWLSITKRLPSHTTDGGDILKTYPTIKTCKGNSIVISKKDFKEVKTLCENMNLVYKERDNTIIESFAFLFAYESYCNYTLQQLNNVKDKEIFNSIILGFEYKKDCIRLKKEIYKRTKEILKEKYNVNLNKYLDGGSYK